MKEALFAIVLLIGGCVCTVKAQGPPPQTAIVYQPVVMQGYWQPVPRPYPIGTAIFGPRWVFYPIPQQPQPQR